jgi:hypothetical protein
MGACQQLADLPPPSEIRSTRTDVRDILDSDLGPCWRPCGHYPVNPSVCREWIAEPYAQSGRGWKTRVSDQASFARTCSTIMRAARCADSAAPSCHTVK